MRGCWGESKGGNTDENTVYSERQTVYTHIGMMIKYQNDSEHASTDGGMADTRI